MRVGGTAVPIETMRAVMEQPKHARAPQGTTLPESGASGTARPTRHLLGEPRRSGGPDAPNRWLKVRIFEKAHSRAKLSLNIPMALADLAFKSLPDDARQELRKKGYDADNFWERLRRLPPAQILEIEGDDGERIQIWIE